jgi:hypothetical protein
MDPEAMATAGSRSDPLRPDHDHKAAPPRNGGAQRRAMRAALAAAVMAMRSGDGRRGGWRAPRGGDV